jgi:hypothetical protein
LVDAPFVAACDPGGEERLLGVEYFLKLIHRNLRQTSELPTDFFSATRRGTPHLLDRTSSRALTERSP